jgi:hypothetical protein
MKFFVDQLQRMRNRSLAEKAGTSVSIPPGHVWAGETVENKICSGATLSWLSSADHNSESTYPPRPRMEHSLASAQRHPVFHGMIPGHDRPGHRRGGLPRSQAASLPGAAPQVAKLSADPYYCESHRSECGRPPIGIPSRRVITASTNHGIAALSPRKHSPGHAIISVLGPAAWRGYSTMTRSLLKPVCQHEGDHKLCF